MDRARLRWQFDFSIETTLTDADGFQPPSVPLGGIQASLAGPDTPGFPLFEIPIQPPAAAPAAPAAS